MNIKYVCNQCGSEFPKWMGKCTSCGTWNSLEEVTVRSGNSSKTAVRMVTNIEYTSLAKLSDTKPQPRLSTGFEEFDRVLGGGIVPGEVILLSGDPGIGKSTILLQTVVNIAIKGKKILYASGEESESQVAMRANRLTHSKAIENAYIVSANDIDAILDLADKIKPDLLVVDSIQTVESTNISGVSGGVAQVKECATAVARFAKSNGIPVVIVGHVNKEGSIAGPKVLEHLVDAVIYLEGDNYREFRILRSVKNRYGAQGEIGVFEMKDKGLLEVNNPSELFINPLTAGSSGVCLSSVIEGLRPIILEVQALTTQTYPGTARRVGSGVEYNRLQLIVAVLSKVLSFKLQNFDVYVNVVGGLKINDPSLDLGICAAIASSYTNKVIGQDTVFIGEIGLAGEIRNTVQMEKRIAEVEKMGLSKIVVSSLYKGSKKSSKCEIVKINTIADMLSTF